MHDSLVEVSKESTPKLSFSTNSARSLARSLGPLSLNGPMNVNAECVYCVMDH